MRFFSLATFAGLVAVSHVAAYKLEARDSHLQSRDDNCKKGEGYNITKRDCEDCDPGTFSGGGFKVQCQPCAAGYSSGKEASSCSPCSAGKYSTSGGTCTSCPADTYSGSGSASCASCPAGQSSAPGSSGCRTVNCPAGKYISSGGCANCPAGTSSGPNASSCSTCPAGTYSSGGASSCSQCPSDKDSSPGSSQCVKKCPEGHGGNGRDCSICPAGTYSSNSQCADCPAGTVSDRGATTCSACPGGSVPAPNRKSCSTCQANTFSNGDNCSPCPNGSTSSPGSSSCGPQPSKRAQPLLSASQMCQGAGFMRCDVLSGTGGTECINTMTTLDSCGGCVGPEGEEYKYSGRDCTAIEHVDQVKCQAGRCNITSCRSGYEPSGGSCVPSAGSVKRGAAHGSRNVKRGLSARHDSF